MSKPPWHGCCWLLLLLLLLLQLQLLQHSPAWLSASRLHVARCQPACATGLRPQSPPVAGCCCCYCCCAHLCQDAGNCKHGPAGVHALRLSEPLELVGVAAQAPANRAQHSMTQHGRSGKCCWYEVEASPQLLTALPAAFGLLRWRGSGGVGSPPAAATSRAAWQQTLVLLAVLRCRSCLAHCC
jgi:hypothetical protein